jgi:hypothetical protein
MLLTNCTKLNFFPLLPISFFAGFRSTFLLNKYKDQKLYVVEIDQYVYIVPYHETEYEIVLMTVFPGRIIIDYHGNLFLC